MSPDRPPERSQYERLAALEQQTHYIGIDIKRLEAHLENMTRSMDTFVDQLREIQHERRLFGKAVNWLAAIVAGVAGYLVHWAFPLQR